MPLVGVYVPALDQLPVSLTVPVVVDRVPELSTSPLTESVPLLTETDEPDGIESPANADAAKKKSKRLKIQRMDLLRSEFLI